MINIPPLDNNLNSTINMWEKVFTDQLGKSDSVDSFSESRKIALDLIFNTVRYLKEYRGMLEPGAIIIPPPRREGDAKLEATIITSKHCKVSPLSFIKTSDIPTMRKRG